MSTWYRSNEDVTHYCGGSTEKEKENKPKGTQTAMTLWFHPVTAEGTALKCSACGATTDTGSESFVDMGD